MNEFIQNNWLLTLGSWVVLSFLAGVVIWLVLKIYQYFYPDISAETRYQMALLSVLSLFTMTLLLVCFWNTSTIFSAGANINSEGVITLNPEALSYLFQGEALNKSSSQGSGFVKQLALIQSLMGIFWLVGVALFTLKFLGGFLYLKLLMKKADTDIPSAWQEKIDQLKAKLQMNQKIKLMNSKRIKSPLTFGFFRPVIFFPIGFFTTLPVDQLEAIILHELYHIKHRDYLVNILVMFLQIIFFYHPLMWKLTQVLQQERENRCDDAVISQTNNRFAYAKALLSVEELGYQTNQMSLYFSKEPSQLNNRIMRIFAKNTASHYSVKPFLGLLALTFFLMSFTWLGLESTSSKDALTMKEGSSSIESLSSNSFPEKSGFTQVTANDSVTLFQQIKILYPNAGLGILTDPTVFINGKKIAQFANVHELIDVQQNKTIQAYHPSVVPYKYKMYAKNGVVLIENASDSLNKNLVAANKTEKVEADKQSQQEESKSSTVPVYPQKPLSLKIASNMDNIETDAVSDYPTSNPDSILIVVDEEVLGLGLDLLEDIAPGDIEKINILKGEKAVEKYGERAKKGVAEVTTKSISLYINGEDKAEIYGATELKAGSEKEGDPYFVIDGKPYKRSKLKGIDPNNIQSINVLKGETALEKYGDKGKNGVIEITTKKE